MKQQLTNNTHVLERPNNFQKQKIKKSNNDEIWYEFLTLLETKFGRIRQKLATAMRQGIMENTQLSTNLFSNM